MTLVELLFSLVVVTLLVAGSFHLLKGAPIAARQAKLAHDVRSLNAAVDVYKVFGGSLAGANTPAEVIERLVSEADRASSQEIAGLSGRMADPRLGLEMQSEQEAASDAPRVHWDANRGHFVVARKGPPGVKAFTLDAPAGVAETEERSAGMKLSQSSGWIWDYQDRSTWHQGAVVEDQLRDRGRDRGPDVARTKKTPSPALAAPDFSIEAGRFELEQFSLSLALSNPNPRGRSRVVYSVDDGSWSSYRGEGILLAPNSVVRAFAESIDSRWANSETISRSYLADARELEPPLIQAEDAGFEVEGSPAIRLSLADRNPESVARLELRVSGGRWESYEKPLLLVSAKHPIGAIVEARAVPVVTYYLESDVSIRKLGRDRREEVALKQRRAEKAARG
ncbi:MAG: type II secretion system protein [Verrucomicrobiales bacterium]